MLKPFRLLEPTTIAEAAGELARLGDEARIYAGGAELLLLLRHNLIELGYLLNIKRIPGLNRLEWIDQTLHIGATVSHARLESERDIRERLPLLALAEAKVGNPRVRSQGTLGGNLCFADPHGDPGTALLVYDARVTVQGSGDPRTLPLEELLVGTYETALASDELLTEVSAQPLPAGWAHAYLRIEQFHRPTVNVAAAVQRSDGHISAARIAVGCVGPKPVRLRDLEGRVAGATVAAAQRLVAESRDYLFEQLDPVDDLLGSADYKIHLAGVLLARALTQAWRGQGEESE